MTAARSQSPLNDFEIIDANLQTAMRFFGSATANSEIADLPGAVAMYSGLDYGVFNIAMLNGFVTYTGQALEDRLAGIARYFRTRSARWSLWLCEDMLDVGIRRRARQTLADFGLRAISHPPGMITSALLPPVRRLPKIDLVPVASAAMQQAFAQITAISFEIPFPIAQAVYAQDRAWQGEYHGHVGLVNGRPAAIVATVVAAEAIGIYSLAADPVYRRQGFGEAVMRAAIEQVQQTTGIQRIVLQSTEAGYSLYRRMGFRDATRFSIYLTK